MRILLSGITKWDEAWQAVEMGVHALGFVLEPHSPRYINPEMAREIICRLPPLISTVGVFQNTPRYVIQELATFCRLDWLLFMGDESPKECKSYHQPVIKYLPKFAAYQDYRSVNAFLVSEKEASQRSKHSKVPYIIYQGQSLNDTIVDAYGICFTLGDIDAVNDIFANPTIFG